jgi:DNA polymerase-3 subunit alpha
MPDIDIDFCDEKRGVVMEYVKEKYGDDAVAQIVTFSKLTMKACVQDVGRVLDIPLDEVRKITSAIPDKGTEINGVKIKKLKQAYDNVPDLQYLKTLSKEQSIFQELIDISLILENTNRGRGTHAAGVIIAPGPVSDFVPTCTPIGSQKDDESLGCDIVTQFQNSSGEVEQCGLLKMDFLGLRTLSIIERTLDMVEQNHGIKIDPDEIPLDDHETFELLSRGETQAIFQFESSGMQEYLKQLKPHSIEELTAMNALYRPGPMDNIPEFIDVKYEKRPMNCYHDDLKPFLTETYGVIVYQEQVMQIGQKLAGFTLGGADVMRRIMGKKKPEAMAKLEPEFKGGFEKEGYSKKLADLLWEVLLPFCNYGFNKSHAVAYSYVAYQTAYLKAHYPAEFIASNMTALMNSQDQVVALIDEAKRYGISIKPPNINISGAYFKAPNAKEIYYGLAGIRNVGIPIVEAIVEGRKEENYNTFFDFIARSDKKVQNKRALEALVCAGTFDTIHEGKRRPLFESIEDAVNYAKAVEKSNENATASIFGSMEESKIPEPPLPKMDDWNTKTRLKNEKDFLNFYLTGHPLDAYKSIINQFNPITIEKLSTLENGTDLKLFGLLSSIVVKTSNRDQSKFAVLVLEDFKDKIECVMWSDAYEAVQHKLELDAAVMISGSLRKKDDSVSITVEDLYTVDTLIDRYVKNYQVFLNIENGAEDKLNTFKQKVTTKIGDEKELVFRLYSTKDTSFNKNYEISTYFNSTIEKYMQMKEIFDPEEKGNIKLSFRMPEFRQAQKRRFSRKKD